MTTLTPDQFILNFFNKIDTILEKKGGKKNKNQIGRGKEDDDLNLPVTLDNDTQNLLNELSGNIQSDETLQSNVKIQVAQSQNIPDDKLNEDFKNHIQLIINNIKTKPTIDMSPEELQVLSLFVSFKNMKSDVTNASNIVKKSLSTVSQMSQTDKVIIEDDKSNENIKLVGVLLEKVEGNTDLVDKQIQTMDTILNSAVGDISTLTTLYETNSSPSEISSASLSVFTNSLGYLSFLFNLLLCYKNRVGDYSNKLKTQNPIIYFIISSIYTCISFIMFIIFKIFIFLINSKIGKIYILIVFIKLYKDDNQFAVFIANTILKLMSIADSHIGASIYINNCIEQAKQSVINSIPVLLTSGVINNLLKSTIQSALLDPTILASFIQKLTPELSSQIIQQSLPILSQGLSDAMASSTPQLVNAVTQSISYATPQLVGAITESTLSLSQNIASELAPVLIEGISVSVTENVGSLVTSSATALVTQTATQMANQQITSGLVNTVSKVALGYAVKAGAYFLTGETTTGDILQQVIKNTGGKRIKKSKKNKRKTKNNKRKTQKSKRKTQKSKRRL
jgi:hypothetical protein